MRLGIWLATASLTLGTAFAASLNLLPGPIYGGVEDGGATSVEGQGDFNDMIYSLVGNGLTLDTFTGQWYSAPNLSDVGSTFWNNASGDGTGMGVGYCIFGGGNCTTEGGSVPSGGYLASGASGQDQVNDVLFSYTGGDVTATLLAKITAWASTDSLGWYDPNDPNLTLHTIFSGTMTPGQQVTFDPTTTFGLWIDADGSGPVFLSDTTGLTHFAFFGSLDTPEPDTIALLSAGLLLLGGAAILKRRRREARSAENAQ